MALLRNREVSVLGPIAGNQDSPIYTVQYADGNREDTPLKFIQMSETEHKQFSKDNPHLANHVRPIPDKEHKDIVESQNPDKIKEKEKRGELNKSADEMVPARTYVRPSEVAPQMQDQETTKRNTVNNTAVRSQVR